MTYPDISLEQNNAGRRALPEAQARLGELAASYIGRAKWGPWIDRRAGHASSTRRSPEYTAAVGGIVTAFGFYAGSGSNGRLITVTERPLVGNRTVRVIAQRRGDQGNEYNRPINVDGLRVESTLQVPTPLDMPVIPDELIGQALRDYGNVSDPQWMILPDETVAEFGFRPLDKSLLTAEWRINGVRQAVTTVYGPEVQDVSAVVAAMDHTSRIMEDGLGMHPPTFPTSSS